MEGKPGQWPSRTGFGRRDLLGDSVQARLDIGVDRRDGPSVGNELERLHDAVVGVTVTSAQHVSDEVDQQRRPIPADGLVVERALGLVTGAATEVSGRDDGDARERGRQPRNEPLSLRYEGDIRHDDDDVVRPLDHPVRGTIEELRRSAPVVIGEPCGPLEIEPPGDVRGRRQFVDCVFGRPRGELPELVGVGPGRVGDEHPDVDLQIDRSLALGRYQFGCLASARPGIVHLDESYPQAH